VAGKVFFIDDLAEPFLYHRGADVVVIGPIFVSGVVRRVDVDTFYFAGVSREKRLKGLEVIAVDYEIVVQGGLSGEGFFLAGDKLMEFDGQVVILNECFSLEIEYGH
jgi:hypothetical protein